MITNSVVTNSSVSSSVPHHDSDSQTNSRKKAQQNSTEKYKDSCAIKKFSLLIKGMRTGNNMTNRKINTNQKYRNDHSKFAQFHIPRGPANQLFLLIHGQNLYRISILLRVQPICSSGESTHRLFYTWHNLLKIKKIK